MRLSPKSMFFTVVALGLPVAATTGWVLGGGDQAPPLAPAPGGAGGFGTAPVRGTSISSVQESWSPQSARAVAVRTRVPGQRPRTERTGQPAPTDRDLPAPTLTARPDPEPTRAPAGPTPAPTAAPSSYFPQIIP